jgi:hypothetical protein
VAAAHFQPLSRARLAWAVWKRRAREEFLQRRARRIALLRLVVAAWKEKITHRSVLLRFSCCDREHNRAFFCLVRGVNLIISCCLRVRSCGCLFVLEPNVERDGCSTCAERAGCRRATSACRL